MDEGMKADENRWSAIPVERNASGIQFPIGDEELDAMPESTRVQHVTKDEDTHQYMPKGSDPDKTYESNEIHRTPWMHEWIRLGEMIEGYAPVRSDMVDKLTINAVIHAQMLKRP